MSRIFDALRQSEQEKQPNDERWHLVPGALPDPPVLSAELESLEEAGLATPSPDPAPVDLPAFPMPAMGRPLPIRPMANDIEPMPLPKQTVAEAPVARSVDVAPAPAWLKLETEAQPKLGSLPLTPPVSGLSGAEIDLSRLRAVPASSLPQSLLVALNSERGLGAEKFRVLGARLSNIRMAQTLGILQVTSSVVGEGKTLTSVNLAMTLATRFAQKVLLAEGDLRKPAVCSLLGLENRAGIGEWWDSPEKPISDFLLRIGETGMCLLPAGNVAHPASVLQSTRIAELFAGLAKQFDWVIIDTPPLLPMADSNLWSRVSDGTLLVVRKGAVSRAALKKAVESLDNPKLVGIVLNDASDYDRVTYYDQYYTEPNLSASATPREDDSR
jgi:capsular exopolysaccharide synthesis family protein